MLQTIFLAHLLRAQYLEPTGMPRPVHTYMVGNKLTVVLVGRSHIDLEARQLRLPGERSDDIVGLKTVHFHHGDVHRLQQVLDDRHRTPNILRCLLALRLIRLKRLMTERRAMRVESDTHMSRTHFAKQVVERDHKAEDGGRVLASAVHARGTDKGVVCAIDHRIRINQE